MSESKFAKKSQYRGMTPVTSGPNMPKKCSLKLLPAATVARVKEPEESRNFSVVSCCS